MATAQQLIDASKTLNDATHTAVDGRGNGQALMMMLDLDEGAARDVIAQADAEAAHRSTRARAEYDVRTDAGWVVTDRLLAIMVGIELGVAAERLRHGDAG